MSKKMTNKMNTISLRIDDDMLNLLKEKANKINMSVSNYLRKSIEWKPVKEDNSNNDLFRLNHIKKEINSIGININQIAKNLNIANKNNILNNEDYNLLINQLYLIYKKLEKIEE